MRAVARSLPLRAAVLAAALAGCASQARADEVVLIPGRVIYPGETISLSLLKEVTLAPGRHKPAAVAASAPELDGKVAKRTLLPGRYVPASAVRDAWLVEQGAPVQVYFVAGPLTISVSAVSLQPGAAGDEVRLRNPDSGKVFTGTVMADGTVRVGAS